MWAILAGLGIWGGLVLWVIATDLGRAAVIVPLLMLTATFEVSFFIHTGVERVGRYLQVYYEEASDAAAPIGGWETTVMRYGTKFPGGLDPLFIRLFGFAAVLNFVCTFPVAVPHPGWAAVSLVAHVGLAWRFLTTRRQSSAQRATDLERFRALKTSSASN